MNTQRLLFIAHVLLCLSSDCIAQGVRIAEDAAAPDNSAILDVDSDQKGMLAPRMTSSQRDAINSPTNGLLIYNTTTNCFNYRVYENWLELCGACTPQPSQANAGPDQLEATDGSADLAANQPLSGSGLWTIVSGEGGTFSGESESTNPTAVFTGIEEETYVLRWTISTGCGSTSDEVTIAFPILMCDPNPPGTLLIPTSGWCDPSPPNGWTQCAGWLNTSGDDVSNAVLNGCLNSNGKLRIRVWNAATNLLEEDVYSTDANMTAWQTWSYHGGSVTREVFTNWVGTSAFFSSTGGGSACYFNENCGTDAPCGTLTLGTGNSSVIIAPGATNQFEYRNNCAGSAFVDRIIAVYK